MAAYYNENDPVAAQWLRNLIAADRIAPGDVDDRSVEDVRAADLLGYRQCHFFAGIGIWSHALRTAGWSDERPAWTGSCPCQPFSQAGRGGGIADERHLWPAWYRLIAECRPDVVFGEQVSSRDALTWLDAVSADLEGSGYAVGAIDTCAAGVGAPHIRQRLFWVADANAERWQREHALLRQDARRGIPEASGSRETDGLADADEQSWDEGGEARGERDTNGHVEARTGPCRSELLGGMGDSDGNGVRWIGDRRTEPEARSRSERVEDGDLSDNHRSPGATRGFWRDAEWLLCSDGKSRPVEPGVSPLAHGVAGRVGKLRAYGNAIVAPLATEFVRAYEAVTALRSGEIR